MTDGERHSNIECIGIPIHLTFALFERAVVFRLDGDDSAPVNDVAGHPMYGRYDTAVKRLRSFRGEHRFSSSGHVDKGDA